MEIKIKRSAKRKKTVSARIEGNIMVVNAPMEISENELKSIIKKFQTRFRKKQWKKYLNASENLADVANRLNKKYFNGFANFNSIKYVTNQVKRYGSCSPSRKTIRISDKLARLPTWVRDYVIVHELAHLIVADHGKKFWSLVNRYPLTERARGYLMALGVLDET